ncbi:histidine phosphatase family protein [Jannaschia sp. Os4]|uniref:SixA phosphatase family protein n=1 Tax=Jannaschia sp. Os4 TaxID=2807617 RepID=UPI00193A80BD|nr:histidine phosphatase family protein [Jannaschia sp. Os4]MBM2577095.1 histidine phosphatase family protein [Jannaschia sp. Os4]
MRAILLRHAKSAWDDPLAGDHARVLTARGRRAAAAMGQWIAPFGPLDRIFVSDAARTVETWERTGLPGAPDLRPDLYHASADTILAALPPGGTALLVGHNGGIGDAAARLAAEAPDHPDFHRFPTCACAVLDFDGPPAWGAGRVAAFAVPRDLTD